MKPNAKGYALAHGISLHQVFTKAWRDTYDQTPNFNQISTDTDRYINFGAVPPYVQLFLKKQKVERITHVPYYAMM